MMITMHLYYTGSEGNARAFAMEMESSGIADRIRQQVGNSRYQYFSPLDDPTSILLVDSWDNQAALDSHHASDMMQEIMKLREKYGLTVRAERYLSDQEGIPESDKKYHTE
ncbi:putative quinol monooxygenase [Streptococcus ruminantium]|uniref:Quinol monooxygenase n=2 Tax=Streptococcus ruminantium TaxID=1917441 RepID=A0ABU1B1Z8_9STRE|nr:MULTISPECIES: putative quinol monooxygenase [Streptococcus]MDQ8758583.1 putative quinol monooxygenase [Streptococcus ruminantium]MDQ8765398.1 putative quinol monooxygenase [Streptococcus ruminantium]MDQ8766212.1 putative quinol monooxygenase [Streptococcus ruminantium]MDQ8769564.1 putative quinol monooxygenase [Streptococcus ruminantium]MDQ8774141.1 putative quinol monooxygenase [Streptococcus ruminantium]